MIVALFVLKQNQLHFRMAVSQDMRNWEQLLERRRAELEDAGLWVREKYYTATEWAKIMPGTTGWTKADDQELLFEVAQCTALNWLKLSATARKQDMKVMKAVAPKLYETAKRMMLAPGTRQVT